MVKNGKYFVAPQHFDGNFKDVFQQLAAAGAGRPVDRDGFPSGPWTPDLLAEAISQIDANTVGIDLRTVQLWFQDNNRGISSDNIRWLARIFGCGDLEATSAWQTELSASNTRLIADRRKMRVAATQQQTTDLGHVETTSLPDQKKPTSLSLKSEAIFSAGSPLNLPSTIFAGAAALGYISYLIGVHSALYDRSDGITKQIGFIWAPNWTFLFMVFLPLFCAFVIDLLVFWKNEGRLTFLKEAERTSSAGDWARRITGSSYTYWSVFLICIGFAGLFQWIGVRFVSLSSGGGDYAIDWGTLALVRPDVISVPQALAFTGFAYLYMCICFYLLFAGLILLYTLAYDLWDIASHSDVASEEDTHEVSLRVMRGIFRCTLLGIMVATCMKLQSFYLTSSGTSILRWLVEDMLSVLKGSEQLNPENTFRRLTHYTSLLVTLATCTPFFFGSVRIGLGSSFHEASVKMMAIVTLLTIGYLIIGGTGVSHRFFYFTFQLNMFLLELINVRNQCHRCPPNV